MSQLAALQPFSFSTIYLFSILFYISFVHLITDNLQKIIALCKKYKVKTLYVFGSILTPRFNDKSDVDFSATFHYEEDPLVAGENRIQFYIGLQELMGRKIDLVDEDCIRNPYFREELNETKQLIYG